MGDSAAVRSRPAWLPLAASALIVPTALAGVTLLWPRGPIENQLTADAGTALAAAGFTGAGLAINGRDATLSGVPDADRQAAIDAVQAVPGIRVAAFPEPGTGGGAGSGDGSGPGPGKAAAPALPAQPLGIARTAAGVVLTGVVGSEDVRADLFRAATAKAGGGSVVDQLTVTPGATLPPGVDATSVGAAAAVVGAATGDMAVSMTPDKVVLTGTAANDAAKAAAEQAVQAAVLGTPVDNQLTVTAPAAPATAPTGDLDAAAKEQLQARITALLAAAPITFGPDSPQLTAQGMASVAKVVEALKPAAGARVQVDGYVAAGPGNGQLTAQQLSDSRAATVRDALVAAGIPADRIAARGLGEGTTPADRALGRRVVITVV